MCACENDVEKDSVFWKILSCVLFERSTRAQRSFTKVDKIANKMYKNRVVNSKVLLDKK